MEAVVETIVEVRSNFVIAMIVPVLIKEGVVDRMVESPKTTAQLVEGTTLNHNSLHRALRFLEANRFLRHEESTGLWHATERAHTIAGEDARTLWLWHFETRKLGFMIHLGELLYSEDENLFQKIAGKNGFEVLNENPDMLEKFQSYMTFLTKLNSDVVVQTIDLKDSTRIVDVGGGAGGLAIGLAKKYPERKFAVYEIESVVPMARANVNKHQLNDQVEIITGSFHESVPSGFDCILLKHICHDWPTEKIINVLKHCRSVLNVGNRLLIVDVVVDRRDKRYQRITLQDIYMLSYNNGKERTLDEYKHILGESGFRLEKVTDAKEDDIIEAIAI
jgi:tRNA A58 N-methylase Trm61